MRPFDTRRAAALHGPLDSNGGELGESELLEVMHCTPNLNLRLDARARAQETELVEAMQAADLDGDGCINYEEFIVATINLAKLEKARAPCPFIAPPIPPGGCPERPGPCARGRNILFRHAASPCAPPDRPRPLKIAVGRAPARAALHSSFPCAPHTSGAARRGARRRRTLRRRSRTSTPTAAAR